MMMPGVLSMVVLANQILPEEVQKTYEIIGCKAGGEGA